LAAEPAGVSGGEEGHGCGDILGLSDAAEWRFVFDLLLEVAADEACGVDAFGFDHAGVDGVDANLTRAKFLGKRDGYGVDRAFGGAINRCGADAAGRDGADVDNASASGIEVFESGLGGEQEAEDVEVELLVEVLGRDGLDGAELVDAGIVDENAYGAKLGDNGLNEGADGIGIGDVGLDGDGLSAGGLDFSDELFGSGLAAGVVDGDCRAAGG